MIEGTLHSIVAIDIYHRSGRPCLCQCRSHLSPGLTMKSTVCHPVDKHNHIISILNLQCRRTSSLALKDPAYSSWAAWIRCHPWACNNNNNSNNNNNEDRHLNMTDMAIQFVAP